MLCLGRVLQHPDSNEAWKNRVTGIQSGKSYKDYDAINGESTEFEWNIFPGFTTLHLCGKINDLLSDLGQTPETFTRRNLFMSMFNDISCDRKGNKDECLANAGVVKALARRFGVGQWSFIGPESEKKWYSSENSPQGAWNSTETDIPSAECEKCCQLEFCRKWTVFLPSVQQLHCPGVSSRAKDVENCRVKHFAADDYYGTIDSTIFRIILSVNQLSGLRDQAVKQLHVKNLTAIKMGQGGT